MFSSSPFPRQIFHVFQVDKLLDAKSWGCVSSTSCLSLPFSLLFCSAMIRKLTKNERGRMKEVRKEYFLLPDATKGRRLAVMMPNSALICILSDNFKLVSVM